MILAIMIGPWHYSRKSGAIIYNSIKNFFLHFRSACSIITARTFLNIFAIYLKHIRRSGKLLSGHLLPVRLMDRIRLPPQVLFFGADIPRYISTPQKYSTALWYERTIHLCLH